MYRIAQTLFIASAMLVLGACAGRALHVALPAPVVVVTQHADEPEAPLPTLPVGEFSISDHDGLTTIVEQEPVPLKPGCDVLAQIAEFKKKMKELSLAVGSKDYRYSEVRAGRKVDFTDPEKEIVLGLLDPAQCHAIVTTITKRGDQLVAASGYILDARRRVNGIRWNNWATEFSVAQPGGYDVLAEYYPLVHQERVPRKVKSRTGRISTVFDTKRTVTPVFNVPYGPLISGPQFVALGPKYLDGQIQSVDAELRTDGVMSKAYPDKLVVDVDAVKPEFVTSLVPIEHMDMTEFLLDPEYTTNRIHAIIGVNEDSFATFTCSPAAACGPQQFIKGTYELMDKVFPAAGLIDDFTVGARDAHNSMKAARLLMDYNLAGLKEGLPTVQYQYLIDHPDLLWEVLHAMYNTGGTRTIRTLKAWFAHKQKGDWIDAKGVIANSHLVEETKGYIAKIRYVREWRRKLAVK